MLAALLTGLVGAVASPPPPPPEAPAAAQVDHDGYAGADLWRAWSAWVRTSAVAGRDHAFEAAIEHDGWRRASDGPVTSSTTGYWNEASDAGFVQLCNGSTEDCEWVYRSARLTARPDDFRAIAEATYDGQAIAARLRALDVTPADLSEQPAFAFPDLDSLDAMLEPTRSVQIVWERDCPAVGGWQARLAAQGPLPLGLVEGARPEMPPPPYPIHIRQIVELPFEAYGGADVTVRVEGVRNRAVSDLWQAITDGIDDCH
jgi:hypothetical protein